MTRRIDQLLRGPHLALPRPLDAIAEKWAAQAPRVRMVVSALIVVATLLGLDARTRAVDDRWGGAPRAVVIARTDLRVGDRLDQTRTVRLPPIAVPPGALETVRPDAVLALALPQGAVVTQSHIDPRGAAVGLDEGMRAVPIPTEPGWGVVAGGWVDVWTLGTGAEASALVARGRPVVEVVHDSSGLTSLVGLAEDEVGAVTSGLALGRVLLAHAPGPDSPHG